MPEVVPMSATVVVADAVARERSAALASRLRLPLVESSDPLPEDCVAWLGYADGRLQLLPRDARQSGPIAVDFGDGASRWRLQGGAELIARAVAGRSKQPLQVLDSLIVAALHGAEAHVGNAIGCRVVALGPRQFRRLPAGPVQPFLEQFAKLRRGRFSRIGRAGRHGTGILIHDQGKRGEEP